MSTKLQPPDGTIYVVRWTNSGRGDTKHKYFRRHHDAAKYLELLTAYCKTAQIFESTTAWAPVDPKADRR